MSSLDKSKLNQANRAGSKGISDTRRVTGGSGGKPVSKPSPGGTNKIDTDALIDFAVPAMLVRDD